MGRWGGGGGRVVAPWAKHSVESGMGCQSGLIWVSVTGGGLPALFNRSADRFQAENVLRNQDNFPAVTYLVFFPLWSFYNCENTFRKWANAQPLPLQASLWETEVWSVSEEGGGGGGLGSDWRNCRDFLSFLFKLREEQEGDGKRDVNVREQRELWW